MSPWAILQIDASADSRTIKRAYARLLKLNRPDDDPEGFQRLHQAYKTALSQAGRHSAPSTADVSAAAPDNAGSTAKPSPEHLVSWHYAFTEESPSLQASSSQQHEDTQRQAALQDLIEQCKTLIHEQNGLFNVQAWHFLSREPLLLNPDLHEQLSHQIFTLLVESQDNSLLGDSGLIDVEADVVRYLNSLLFWDTQKWQLCHGKPEQACETIFSIIESGPATSPSRAVRGGKSIIPEKIKKKAKKLHYYYFSTPRMRGFAALLDLFSILLLVDAIYRIPLLSNYFSQPFWTDAKIYIVLFGYIVLASLFEKSRLQATPWKLVLGLKVMDHRFDPLSWKKAGLRAVCMSSIPLVFIFSELMMGYAPLIVFGLLFANGFLDGNFIQDRLTKTHVVNWRLSNERQEQR